MFRKVPQTNLDRVEWKLKVGKKSRLDSLDRRAEAMFHDSLKKEDLKGRWWREY